MIFWWGERPREPVRQYMVRPFDFWFCNQLEQFKKFCIRRADDSLVQPTMSGCTRTAFSLTPTLPTERESPQRVPQFMKEHLANPALDFLKWQKTIPPLLEGEGRGEGERRTFHTQPYNKLKRSKPAISLQTQSCDRRE
jgi:hypothetical protein